MPKLTHTNSITILGAGIIGLAQALLLLKNGFEVTLIDKSLHPDAEIKCDPLVYDVRVLALTPQTKQFLYELDVWDDIQTQRICPYQAMLVWDGKGTSKITFEAASLQVDALGYIVEQSIILKTLLAKAQPYLHKGQLKWLTQEPIILMRDIPEKIGIKIADDRVIYSALLIGADGADSWLRKQAGLSVTSQFYNQSAIVATIQCQQNHQYTAYQRFSEEGPLALLPLSDLNKVSIVWTQSTQSSEALLALSETEFNRALTQFSENILGELSLVGTRKSFVLKSLQAKSYGSDRIVLIGDSAHVIHPLAGLGANLGFQDVICLGALLQKQFHAKKDLGSNHIIQRYYRERIAKNEAIRLSMTALNKLFSHQHPMIKLLRNWGLHKTNHFTLLKNWFAKQAMGISK